MMPPQRSVRGGCDTAAVLSTATRRSRGGRLALVAGVAALLTALGLVGLPRVSSAAQASPAQLLERAAASTDVAYTATAVSFGSLGLPDLPRLGSLTALLGSNTRTRVAWAAPARHRVDELLAGGERGTYVLGDQVTTWSYEAGRLTTGATLDRARLPRPEDLLPPQVVRGLLAGLPGRALAGDASLLGTRRVAGRLAQGLRVTSTDARSTLSHADVWVDDASGLPSEVSLVDTAGTTALLARFDSLEIGAPDPSVLLPPDAPGAERRRARDDVVTLADDFAPWRMPDTLAGYPSLRPPLGAGDLVGQRTYSGTTALSPGDSVGVQVYGSGLTRVAVLPLEPRTGSEAVRVFRASGGVEMDARGTLPPGGDAVLLAAGAVRLAMVRSSSTDPSDGAVRSYLLAGDVDPAVLDAAVAELVADPPRWQRGQR